jgi:hypothetical protein
MAIDWKGLAYRLRLQKRNLEDQLADMSLAFLDERARTTVLERQIAALQAVAEPALPITRGSPGFRPRPPCIDSVVTGHNPSIRQGTSSRRSTRPAQRSWRLGTRWPTISTCCSLAVSS